MCVSFSMVRACVCAQEQARAEAAELQVGGGAEGAGGYIFLRPDGTVDLDRCGGACANVFIL